MRRVLRVRRADDATFRAALILAAMGIAIIIGLAILPYIV
jgi:hypothetical protein